MTPTPSPAAVYRMPGRPVDQYPQAAPQGWRYWRWVPNGVWDGAKWSDGWVHSITAQGGFACSTADTHWSPDSTDTPPPIAPEAPKEAPDDGWEAQDQESNGYPIPAPTPLSPAESKPLEGVNTVGWPASKMQDHVFDCHEEIRGLRDQLTAARQDLANQERTTDAYYKEMHGPDGYRVRLDAADSQLIAARRESEGLRAERDEVREQLKRVSDTHKYFLQLSVLSDDDLKKVQAELATLRAELEKAKEERETDNKERNAHIASLQSALGKAEEDKARFHSGFVELSKQAPRNVVDAVLASHSIDSDASIEGVCMIVAITGIIEDLEDAAQFEHADESPLRAEQYESRSHAYGRILSAIFKEWGADEKEIRAAIDSARSAQRTPGEGKGE